jgi:hypothetical protein
MNELMAKRLRAMIAALEETCFERMDGLRELWAQWTPERRDRVMREHFAPIEPRWFALTRLYEQAVRCAIK